jgi:hypothetical protein
MLDETAERVMRAARARYERIVDARRALELVAAAEARRSRRSNGAIREWNRDLTTRSGSDREGRGRHPGVEPGVDHTVGK